MSKRKLIWNHILDNPDKTDDSIASLFGVQRNYVNMIRNGYKSPPRPKVGERRKKSLRAQGLVSLNLDVDELDRPYRKEKAKELDLSLKDIDKKLLQIIYRDKMVDAIIDGE